MPCFLGKVEGVSWGIAVDRFEKNFEKENWLWMSGFFDQVLHFSQGVNLLLKTDESEPKVKILDIIQQQNTSKFMPYYFLSLLHWFQKCHFLKINFPYYFWVVPFLKI